MKGVALNLTRSPEKHYILGMGRSSYTGRRRSGADVIDKSVAATPGLKTASSHTTTGK